MSNGSDSSFLSLYREENGFLHGVSYSIGGYGRLLPLHVNGSFYGSDQAFQVFL